MTMMISGVPITFAIEKGRRTKASADDEKGGCGRWVAIGGGEKVRAVFK